jgi:hypothetical protein
MNFWYSHTVKRTLEDSGFKIEDQLGPLSDGSYDYRVTSGVTELRPKMPREAMWLLRLGKGAAYPTRAHTMIHDGDTGELLVQADLTPVEIVAKMNELADALYTKWMNATGGI